MSNANCAAPMFRVRREDEMEAMDALGPLASRAFNEAPVSILAFLVLQQLRALHLDPQNPKIDEAVAVGIRNQSYQLVLLDRPPEDAQLSITPLVPRGGRHR